LLFSSIYGLGHDTDEIHRLRLRGLGYDGFVAWFFCGWLDFSRIMVYHGK